MFLIPVKYNINISNFYAREKLSIYRSMMFNSVSGTDCTNSPKTASHFNLHKLSTIRYTFIGQQSIHTSI